MAIAATEARALQTRSPAQVLVVAASVICVLLLGLAIAAYGNTAYYTRYLADDYCIAAHVNHKGLIGAQSFWYMNWTGRFGSTFLSDLVPWVGPGAMPFYGPFLIAALFAATVCACYQAGQMLLSWRSLLISSLVAGAMVFGYLSLMPDRTQGLYWLAGGTNYSGPLVLFALNVGVMAWGARSGGRALYLAGVATCLLAFVSSGFAETFVAWHLALIVLVLALVIRFGKGVQNERALALLKGALFSALIGTTVVVFAPGNYGRQRAEGATGELAETTERSVLDSLELLGELLLRPEAWLVAAVMLAVTAALTAGSAHQGVRVSEMSARIAVVLVITYILLVATFVPGYHFLGGGPPDRALAMGAVSVVLGMAGVGYVLGRALAPYWPQLTSRPKVVAPLVVLVLMAAASVVLPPALSEFSRIDDLSAYAAAWDRRDQQLRDTAQSRIRDVTVPLLVHNSGYELRPNPRAWMNACAAGYYGVRSIVAE